MQMALLSLVSSRIKSRGSVLDDFVKWCDKSHLQLTVSKTKDMITHLKNIDKTMMIWLFFVLSLRQFCSWPGVMVWTLSRIVKLSKQADWWTQPSWIQTHSSRSLLSTGGFRSQNAEEHWPYVMLWEFLIFISSVCSIMLICCLLSLSIHPSSSIHPVQGRGGQKPIPAVTGRDTEYSLFVLKKCMWGWMTRIRFTYVCSLHSADHNDSASDPLQENDGSW